MTQESSIKHTNGAEMPDASAAGEFERRVKADFSLLGDPKFLNRFWAPLLFMGLGIGFFVWRRSQK